jgi:quercetin dioxygenase-like cupin family protein
VTGDQRSTSARREPPGVQPEPGTAVVPLSPGRVLRRCRAAAADVVVTVLAGAAVVTGDGPPRRLVPGESATCPRGTAFRLTADAGDGALLRVTARPPGPEAVFAVLAAVPPVDDATLLAAAADGGVEVLLDPVARSSAVPQGRAE